jgi:hypothetical protein
MNWTLRLYSILESSECSHCSDCCGNTSSTVHCCGNLFSEAVTPEWESCIVGCVFVGTCLLKPLPSYSRIFWFQYSSFQAARHNILNLTGLPKLPVNVTIFEIFLDNLATSFGEFDPLGHCNYQSEKLSIKQSVTSCTSITPWTPPPQKKVSEYTYASWLHIFLCMRRMQAGMIMLVHMLLSRANEWILIKFDIFIMPMEVPSNAYRSI